MRQVGEMCPFVTQLAKGSGRMGAQTLPSLHSRTVMVAGEQSPTLTSSLTERLAPPPLTHLGIWEIHTEYPRPLTLILFCTSGESLHLN